MSTGATTASAQAPLTRRPKEPLPIAPPAWAHTWENHGLATLRCRSIPRAADASADDLRDAVAAAYAELLTDLANSPFPHANRMWNFIPDIHRMMPNGEDRYMAFNAGRHDALTRQFGPHLPLSVPAATGVGHRSPDLTIWALGMKTAPDPVENPLQTPAYRYSKRYGALPPCFARANRTPHGLLLSGTAAIRGESTLATDDLHLQLTLTLENLAALTGSARIKDARAYIPTTTDRDFIETLCERHFDHVEIVEADLCRRDLLVEIEGLLPA